MVSIDARERAEYVPSLPEDVLVAMDGGIVDSADLVANAVGAQAWPITHPDAEVAVAARTERGSATTAWSTSPCSSPSWSAGSSGTRRWPTSRAVAPRR